MVDIVFPIKIGFQLVVITQNGAREHPIDIAKIFEQFISKIPDELRFSTTFSRLP